MTLLEREARPGLHASGRNAGLIRRVVEDPAVAALARDGADLLCAPPEDLRAAADGHAFVRPTGSVLLAGPDGAAGLRRAAREARAAGVDCRLRRPLREGRREEDRLEGALLGLVPAPGGVAVETPDDGVADPHAVLSALLGAARVHGAEVRLGVEVRLRRRPSGVLGVEADGQALDAEVVVNAAGPWAADLVAETGAAAVPLVSYRRHLFYTGALPGIDPQAPWVWDIERGFYLRPESSGLLLCACDAEPRPPEDARPADAARDALATKVAALAPGLGEVSIERAWAGLRTFAPDARFVIGWDPALRGLFWLAGLGGHGLTTCGALGELVAEALDGRTSGAAQARLRDFDPARFVGAAPAAAGSRR